jgi:two-component system chemotaxis sensor kinase CheA
VDPLEAIKVTFFQECEEQLAELESGLLRMQEGDTDPETINAVFRAVHSVKGGAGAFSLEALVRFAHVFETALDHMRAGRLAPEPDTVLVMLRATDILTDHVRAARDGGSVDEARTAELAAELEALGSGGGSSEPVVEQAPSEEQEIEGLAFQPLRFDLEPEAPVSGAWTIRFRPHDGLYAKANDPANLLRELGRLGELSVELDTAQLPALEALEPESSYLAWTATLVTDQGEPAIREVFDFVEGDCDLEIIAPSGGGGGGESAAVDDFDVMALIQAAQASATPAADAEPKPAAPEAVLENAPAAPAVPAPPASVSAAPVANSNAAAPRAPDAPAATIRVDLERVDRLIDLVGELVINQAMLAQRVMEAGLARSSNVAMGLDDLEQLTREIQDSVMAIRAQPVKSVFQRMPRLVREVAAMTGKQVRLVTEGETTEVDKTVIERLTDPITHMIRNAIDHGLETPEKRLAAGKPAEGVVRLSALHRSGRIVIEVADDGAGINRPRVKGIAVEKGLIAADAQLTDEEIDNLIFAPGFSTADAVSDISGRGVGMDVVKRSIQALGGRISIVSRPGQGSTFTLSLPLTLAVLDGMAVTVCGQTLVAPLAAIVESFQPRESDVRGLGANVSLIHVRGAYLPLIDVGVALNYRRESPPAANGVALLVEGENGDRAALLVDAILGQRQVVIKSLEANYRQVEGVAAATVMGDGRVAFILDVDAIVERRRREPARSDASAEIPMAKAG